MGHKKSGITEGSELDPTEWCFIIVFIRKDSQNHFGFRENILVL